MGKPKKSDARAQIDAILAKSKKNNDKGGGARKYGRYKTHPSSMRYKGEQRWLRNRVRRIMRHLKRFPADLQAVARLDELR